MALDTADEPDDPVLSRAAQELRDEEVPSWVEASTAILAALRATARRTRALDASHPGFVDGDSLRVGDHLVLLSIARALSELPCGVKGIDLDVDGRRCTGVSLDIAVTYGQDMAALAVTLTGRTADAVNTTLGTALTAEDVAVHVVDVLLP
ncbi:hypothetical protein HQ312_05330 [Rhodococcus sp. BP-316]|jgi:hypothetical protein|uniref:hypothetical protein n=1 Tax=unclassified Rhodococcus (in: high G+C Gram-positive bacteria) TaxID=192944 RepID=UPI001C9AFED1|nr:MULTISPECIES: hypothetical protein [unclassified Rhodococcus (in: high G+C Gram-positive bacteria)]MBY6680468.1 hypothetical protein [Rhodococcus sp. BP-316]MDQ1199983.1 hypothetical protein [Rhodococcus sp. SORGH_AS_0303]